MKEQRWVPAALLATVALLSGCANISEQTHAYLGSPEYPPTAPGAVQILRAEPKRPKVLLGEIILGVEGNPSRQTLEAKLKAAAAKLGADAVFVVSDRTHVFPFVYGDWYWGPMGVTEEAHRHIVVVAIKYKADSL
ncbi:MAG: hypothetical protein ABSA69_00350 [Verrucomicrobiota bacterium]